MGARRVRWIVLVAALGTVHATTNESFDRDILRSGGPAIVEFYAIPCWPCMRLAPHLKRAAARHAGRVTFWKLNAGWSAESRRRYRFHAVPTLIFYDRGKEVARLEGMPAREPDREIDRLVEEGLRVSRRSGPRS